MTQPTEHERETALALYQRLSRDGIMRQGSPVDTIAQALASHREAALREAAAWHESQANQFERAAMGDRNSGAARAALFHRLGARAILALIAKGGGHG